MEEGAAVQAKPAPRVAVVAPWRLAPAVLLAGFALRVLLALNTETIQHADEVFQYLEPAHRLVFHWGWTPWEYQYGIRSWIIPGCLSALLETLKLLGWGTPQVYTPAVKIALCLVSLSLPASIYRIAQLTLDERAARIALVLSAVWYELVYYAHKPLADALSAYALYGAMALGLRPTAGVRRAAGFGAVCGLAMALRFQIAPSIAILLAIAFWRWRRNRAAVFAALAGVAAVTAASGLFDTYTWGVPFSSVWLNVKYNLFSGVADVFGRSGPDYYPAVLLVTSAGLVVPAVIGLGLRWRTTWPVALVGFSLLAEFSLIGHKEPRFVFALAPATMIGLAAAACYRPRSSGVSAIRDVAGWGAAAIPAAAVAASLCGAFWLLPVERGVYTAPLIGRSDDQDAYHFLSRRDDVQGVIDQSDVWSRLGGYYALNRPTPIYVVDSPATQPDTVLAAPERYASYWVRRAGAPSLRGYHPLRRFGQLLLWRRDRDPPRTLTPPGYTTRLAFPALKTPPLVRPRW